MVAVEHGGAECVGREGEPQRVRIAVIGNRRPEALTVVHDVNEMAQPVREASDANLGP